MEIQMDEDVLRVAADMQQSIPADKLVGVAKALAELAPLIWGRHGKAEISALRLRQAPIK